MLAALLSTRKATENKMNKYTITLTVETYSENPEEWVADAIAAELEGDETVSDIKVERV